MSAQFLYRRRTFIAGLGAAAAWPLAGRAQQAGPRRIAIVIGISGDAEGQARAAAFRETLRTFGWIEGRNVRFDVRFTDGRVDRAGEYASELLSLMPDLVLANSVPVVEAFMARTRTVPIIFAQVLDPVGAGYVQSLAKPGGNVTGFTSFDYSMTGKWLEALKEIAPTVTRVALLRTPGAQTGPFGAIQAVAPYLHVEIAPVDLRDAASLERGLDSFARDIGGGMVVPATPLATVHRDLIVSLAAKYRLPAVYPYRYFVAGGGLMSYGIDNLDLYRRAASYADRILKGEKPADLPVQAPTKFELVVNRKTAEALGIDVPATLLARADEVIE
jgi:putative tryptophan/tyrosine transport system substrate-binding protein